MKSSWFAVPVAAAFVLITVGSAIAGPAAVAVPEPATLTLLVGGIGVLAAARYLRRK